MFDTPVYILCLGLRKSGIWVKRTCRDNMETCEFLVQISDLDFARGDRQIYSNINLEIPKGMITVIMGPSGCGKTTLLSLISGQLAPDKGNVLVDGLNVPDMKRQELFALRKKMGLLYQQGALFSNLNVFDNVAFTLREHTNLSESMISVLVLAKLEAVGLRGARNLAVSELSGGMARRVALARALMLDPMLMMYDEPFAGQDPITRGVLLQLIRQLNDSLDLTSIVVTHDVEETKAIADYVVVVADGAIVGRGDIATVFGSDNPEVQQFLAGSPDGPVPFRFPCALSMEQEMGELCS